MHLTNANLPLFAFFDALRKNGFPLGISEYYALLDALQLSYGIDEKTRNWDKKALLKYCKLLWLKPNQSKFVFEQLYWDNLELNDSELPDIDAIPESTPDDEAELNTEKDRTKNTPEPQELNTANTTNTAAEEPLVKFVLGNSEGEAIKIPEEGTKLKRKFFFSDNYFELSKRQMQQVCRFLPNTQPSLRSQTIDVEATVQQFAESGWIGKPVFKRQERVVNNVLLLIDHEGSMLAFDRLVEHFATALQDAFRIQQKTKHPKVAQYYFYNVPQQYCYKNKAHTEHKKTSELLAALHPQHAMVIIVSDAGAARGGNSNQRFKSTLRFVLQAKRATQKIVWLNPMPSGRWKNTTAERIARFVPMFSLDTQQELQKAINSLKGK